MATASRRCSLAVHGGLNVGLGNGGHSGLLRQHQAFALRFRNWIAELPRRFKPQVNGLADVLQRRLLRVTVGRASRKLGRFGHKRAVFVAPLDDDFILVH